MRSRHQTPPPLSGSAFASCGKRIRRRRQPRRDRCCCQLAVPRLTATGIANTINIVCRPAPSVDIFFFEKRISPASASERCIRPSLLPSKKFDRGLKVSNKEEQNVLTKNNSVVVLIINIVERQKHIIYAIRRVFLAQNTEAHQLKK